MNSLIQLMRYATAHTNDATARLLKERAPYFFVAEFPRSGGNWLRGMIGDALQLPVPRFSILPVTFKAVLQTHSHRPIHGVPTIYLVRDGRDVLLSHFYKALNSVRHGNAMVKSRVLQHHPSLARCDEAERQDSEALPAFYAEWRERSAGSKVSWGKHVRAWTSSPDARTLVTRYEDLVVDAGGALARVTQHLGAACPEYVLDFAVRRNSFAAQTGRKPGEVDNASNRRAGSPGIWRRELPDAIAAAFVTDFGEELNMMGYEISGRSTGACR